MTPEKDAELRKRYPLVFQRPLLNNESIRCGDGWFDLLDRLFFDLTGLIDGAEQQSSYYAEQIKEKFGGLRVYMSRTSPGMRLLIQQTEKLADQTCEVCGKPGTLRSGGWIRTLCDEDNAEHEARFRR